MANDSMKMTIVSVKEKAPVQVSAGTSGTMQIMRVTHADPLRLEMTEGKYFRSERSAAVRQAVELALQAVGKRAPYADLPRGVDPREVKHILSREHPQLFVLSNMYEYIFTEQMSRLYFYYQYSAEEAARLEGLVREEVSRVVRGARRKKGNVERLKYVYDWFSGNLKYNRVENHPPEDYSVVGTFVHHKAVCAGFAKAFQLVCKRLGIDSAYVYGRMEAGDEVGHAWNLVWLDGYVYHIDATAGVTFFETAGRIAYPCFLCTTEEIKRSRLIEMDFTSRDNPQNTYLASIGCRFEDARALDRILSEFVSSQKRMICIQAGEAYANEGKMMDQVRSSMQRTGCGGMMYHYTNGVCIIIKGQSRKSDKEFRIVKLTVH